MDSTHDRIASLALDDSQAATVPNAPHISAPGSTQFGTVGSHWPQASHRTAVQQPPQRRRPGERPSPSSMQLEPALRTDPRGPAANPAARAPQTGVSTALVVPEPLSLGLHELFVQLHLLPSPQLLLTSTPSSTPRAPAGTREHGKGPLFVPLGRHRRSLQSLLSLPGSTEAAPRSCTRAWPGACPCTQSLRSQTRFPGACFSLLPTCTRSEVNSRNPHSTLPKHAAGAHELSLSQSGWFRGGACD